MNVLINCLSAVSGGAVSYLRNLIPKLAKLFEGSERSHSIEILAHMEQKQLFPPILESQCILLTSSRPMAYRRFWWEYCNIGRIVRQQNIDVLFNPCQVSPRASGVKQVMMLHNMEPFFSYRYKYSLRPWLRNQLLALQSQHSLRAADRVIAVSDYVKQILVDCLNVSPNQIKQIYHGRDVNFSPEGDEQNDNKILKRLGIRGNFVLTCGSLWPYRRCEDVIKAFDRYQRSISGDFSLVIAGSLMDARYGKVVKSAIAESPNAGRIHTVGHVPYETMQTLYRRCSLCVIATEVEACPIIAIEAMSSGCVIVSSDQPPLPEIFRGGSMKFRHRNVEDLAFKMQRLMSDEQQRADLKRQALNRAQDFSWDRCAEQTYLALIKWEEK